MNFQTCLASFVKTKHSSDKLSSKFSKSNKIVVYLRVAARNLAEVLVIVCWTYLGTDATQIEMTSHKIGFFFSVGLAFKAQSH